MAERAMNLSQDLKFSFRTLRRTPSVTLLALCALVLGIGANAALFTVVNAVLLRPLNYPEPHRLLELHRQYPGGTGWAISATKFLFWERENRSFESLGASDVMSSGLNLTGSGEPERLHSLRVTSGWFRALRVSPFIGRAFTASEDSPGAGPICRPRAMGFGSDASSATRGLSANLFRSAEKRTQSLA